MVSDPEDMRDWVGLTSWGRESGQRGVTAEAWRLEGQAEVPLGLYVTHTRQGEAWASLWCLDVSSVRYATGGC